MKLWEYGFVKESDYDLNQIHESQRYCQLQLLTTLEPTNNQLNLADNMIHLWEKIEKYIINTHAIYVIFGKEAGFTDSRMLYTWAKSHQLFAKAQLYTILEKPYITKALSQTTISPNVLEYILEHGSNELPYARLPRIGTKIIN